MSLNREQWIQMWNAIKEIEWSHENHHLDLGINEAIKLIKELIQSVIGQME